MPAPAACKGLRAAGGESAMIRYQVDKGADMKAMSRSGQTTVNMASGPAQRSSPFRETIAQPDILGSGISHFCVSC